MKIDHVALWTNELEALRDFYQTHFRGVCGEKYVNTATGFESYFISFEGGVRIELMRRRDVRQSPTDPQRDPPSTGYAHVCFRLNNMDEVNQTHDRFCAAGVEVFSAPRRTGDGYYEFIIRDPDGNIVELGTEFR